MTSTMLSREGDGRNPDFETVSLLRDHSHREYDEWSSFTGRPNSILPLESARPGIFDKRVLVTGAGGFIGSALTKEIVRLGPRELLLVDVCELGLHELDVFLQSTDAGFSSRLIVGNIGDSALVDEIFKRHPPQVVFHAAACKHVPLMEANPFTAAATNVLGTRLIVEAAVAAGAEQCILLSTDKAVDPDSIMGATKRVAELMFLSQNGSTKLKVLRLGNVFGSSGSVVPLFLQQISRGGPVTVTHPEATRFFLSVNEAVKHLLTAVMTPASQAILVPHLEKAQSICELARFLITEEPEAPPEIGIVFKGLRPGDKIAEQMISPREHYCTLPMNGLRLVRSSIPSDSDVTRCLETIDTAVAKRDLDLLLAAIAIVVPEYNPSCQLLDGSTLRTKAHSR